MRLRPIAFALATVGIVASILVSRAEKAEPIQVGSEAPDFKVRRLDGTDVALSSLKGRVVFLNFWRTDCGPCEAEMPEMA